MCEALIKKLKAYMYNYYVFCFKPQVLETWEEMIHLVNYNIILNVLPMKCSIKMHFSEVQCTICSNLLLDHIA